MNAQSFRLILALIGLFAFLALLCTAIYLASSALGFAALAGGAVAVAAEGLFILLTTLAKR